MRRAILPLLLMSFHPLAAREVRLGLEVPVTPLSSIGPASGTQNPTIASNGVDFLAAWYDGEMRSVYATRVLGDGTPVEPLGHRIRYADGTKPLLASAGSDFLLVAGNHSQRLDINGVAVSPTHILPSQGAIALISNGRTYLLLQQVTRYPVSLEYELLATILDRDGAQVASVQLAKHTPVAVGVHDGRYLAVSIRFECNSTSCQSTPVFDEINDVATVTKEVTTTPIDNIQKLTAAVTPSGVILAGVASSGNCVYFLYDHDGRLISPLLNGQSVPLATQSSMTTVLWDGHEYLLINGAYAGAPVAYAGAAVASRVSATGVLIDSKPFLLPWRLPSLAASGAGFLAVWEDPRFDPLGDIVSRPFRDFDELAVTPDRATLVSYSGEGQFDLRVLPLPSGRGFLSVWTDLAHTTIRAAIGGNVVTLARSSSVYALRHPVAAIGSRTLAIAWMDSTAFPPRIVLQRLTPEGGLLGPALAISTTSPFPNQSPDLLFSGDTYAIAWSGPLQTAQVSEAGVISNRVAIATPANEMSVGYDQPHLLASREGTLITYSVFRASLIPEFHFPLAAGLAHLVTTSPTVSSTTVFDDIGEGFASAVGNDRIVFAWRRWNGFEWLLEVAQCATDGKQLAPATALAHLGGFVYQAPPPAAIAWNGSEFVIAWNQPIDAAKHGVRASRLNALGEDLDDRPIEVASGMIVASTPSVAVTPSGVVIAYSRDDQSNGSAPRGFIRTLDRLPPILRGRSVRR